MSDTTDDPVGNDLLRRIEDGICWITLNRPEAGNAMTQFMRDQIADWVRDASADLFVRVVVITAAGDKAFCTGADLRGGRLPPRPKPEDAPDSVVGEGSRMIRDGWQRLVTSILDCEKPVIAGVNGTAAGGGMHLALACDLVVMAEEAKFVEVFVRRGIAPDAGGAWILTRLVGIQKAKELFFFGDDVPAAEAYRIGLVNRLVPRDRAPGHARGDGRPPGQGTDEGDLDRQVADQPRPRRRPCDLAVRRGYGAGAGHQHARLQGGHRQLRGAPAGRIQGLVAPGVFAVVVVVTPTPVVVVVEAPGDVVVVELPGGAVVLVVVLVGVDVVVVEDVVVVVDVVEDVVVVGAGGGVLFSEVPVPALPKIDANGLPEMSSMAVMNISASTNTMAAVPAMAGQENRRAGPPAGCIGKVVACRRSVAGAVGRRRDLQTLRLAQWCRAAADLHLAHRLVGRRPDDASPLAPVAPSLRRSVDDSGARTTTCLTASWPRSMDWATRAVPRVATADPMATPMIVPLTPKIDAMSAAITAPAALARIWRTENFTQEYLVALGATSARATDRGRLGRSAVTPPRPRRSAPATGPRARCGGRTPRSCGS